MKRASGSGSRTAPLVAVPNSDLEPVAAHDEAHDIAEEQEQNETP